MAPLRRGVALLLAALVTAPLADAVTAHAEPAASPLAGYSFVYADSMGSLVETTSQGGPVRHLLDNLSPTSSYDLPSLVSAVSADSRTVAVMDATGLWTASSGQEWRQHAPALPHRDAEDPVTPTPLALSPDGTVAYYTSLDPRPRIHALTLADDSDRIVAEPAIPAGSLTVAPDGALLAYTTSRELNEHDVSRVGQVHVVDLTTGRDVRRARAAGDALGAVFAPDGHLLVSVVCHVFIGCSEGVREELGAYRLRAFAGKVTLLGVVPGAAVVQVGPLSPSSQPTSSCSVQQDPCPDAVDQRILLVPWDGTEPVPVSAVAPGPRDTTSVPALAETGLLTPRPRQGDAIDPLLLFDGNAIVAPVGRAVTVYGGTSPERPGTIIAALQARQGGLWRTLASAAVRGGGVGFRVVFRAPTQVRLVVNGKVRDSARVLISSDVTLQAARSGSQVVLRGRVAGPRGGAVQIQRRVRGRWVAQATAPVRGGAFALRMSSPAGAPSLWRAVRPAQGEFAQGASRGVRA